MTGSQRSSLWKAIQELTHDLGVQREDLMEVLSGPARDVAQYWGVDTKTKPVIARRIVVENLRACIERLKVRRANQPMSLAHRDEQYRHAALVGFNICDKHGEDRRDNLTKRRVWLSTEAPRHLRVEFRTSQRELNNAISQIEQQILTQGYVPVEGTVAKPQSESPYVRRSQLHTQFEAIVNASSEPVRMLLTGMAGMGKTTLATELARDFASVDDIQFISMMSEASTVADLAVATQRYELPMRNLSPEAKIQGIAVLLSALHGPKYVIFDSIDSPTSLINLVPRQSTVNVIATCRTSDNIPYGWTELKVGRMTVDESAAMATRLLPLMGTQEAADLGRILHGHPLAIKRACRLLAPRLDTVHDFTKSLKVSQDEFNRAIRADDGSAISAAIVESWAAVRRIDEQAGNILDCVATLCVLLPKVYEFSGVFLRNYLLEVSTQRYGQDTLTLIYANALDVLRGHGFVESEDRDCVQLHPTTASILANLMRSKVASTIDAVMRAHYHLIPPGTLVDFNDETGPYAEVLARRTGDTVGNFLALDYYGRLKARYATLLTAAEMAVRVRDFGTKSSEQMASRFKKRLDDQLRHYALGLGIPFLVARRAWYATGFTRSHLAEGLSPQGWNAQLLPSPMILGNYVSLFTLQNPSIWRESTPIAPPPQS